MRSKCIRMLSMMLIVVILGTVVPTEMLTVNAAGVSLEILKSQYPETSTWKSNYDNASQCHGWALMIADKTYGYSSTSTNRCRNRTRLYNADVIKAGDVIRVYRSTALSDNKAHTIFVTAVDGNTIVYADCNWDNNCGIRWDETITKKQYITRVVRFVVLQVQIHLKRAR